MHLTEVVYFFSKDQVVYNIMWLSFACANTAQFSIGKKINNNTDEQTPKLHYHTSSVGWLVQAVNMHSLQVNSRTQHVIATQFHCRNPPQISLIFQRDLVRSWRLHEYSFQIIFKFIKVYMKIVQLPLKRNRLVLLQKNVLKIICLL